MKLFSLPEPELQFAADNHICPRAGITLHSVYDAGQQSRRDRIHIGAVGTQEGLEKLHSWLDTCSREIPGKRNAKQPTLFPAFCGFNRHGGFRAEFLLSTELVHTITNAELKEVNTAVLWREKVDRAVDAYFRGVKFLAQNRTVDVIVCVLPDNLYENISSESSAQDSEQSDETDGAASEEADDAQDEIYELETNFRRLLKAQTLSLGRPIQIVREHSLDEDVTDQQDPATKAWNFCTALYYKSGQTIPWKLVTDKHRPSVCAVGVSFYRSRDRQTLNTSLAQIFDELGNGLILRGTPVQADKLDRRPFLTEDQSADLITRALGEYRDAVRTPPARLVIHKSSNFRPTELEGFRSAAQALGVEAIDFVTITPSKLRLFRGKMYPPYRGTRLEIERNLQLLYTRGSVAYYNTYPGLYVPEPLELRIVESEASAAQLCQEVLGLTKMNWNNTQFDGKLPVTLGCARKVGEILKYLSPEGMIQIRYSYLSTPIEF
jgi:hypothetical protein